MRVGAVIVVHAGTADLERCVASVRDDVEEVVVVDNGDGTAAVEAERIGATGVRTSNRGFGAGQNFGVARTESELLLLLNPDARLLPGALREGMAVLQRSPRAAGVQGICRNEDGAPERSQGILLSSVHLWGRALRLSRIEGTRFGRWVGSKFASTSDHIERVPNEPTEVAWLSATALLIRRSAFEDVGGFDERFFMYGEDLDLCRRLSAAGWTLVSLPVEWARHTGGTSFDSAFARELDWWRGTLLYASLWWPSGAWRSARLATLARSLTMAERRLDAWRAFRSAVHEAARFRVPR